MTVPDFAFDLSTRSPVAGPRQRSRPLARASRLGQTERRTGGRRHDAAIDADGGDDLVALERLEVLGGDERPILAGEQPSVVGGELETDLGPRIVLQVPPQFGGDLMGVLVDADDAGVHRAKLGERAAERDRQVRVVLELVQDEQDGSSLGSGERDASEQGVEQALQNRGSQQSGAVVADQAFGEADEQDARLRHDPVEI